ncbi:hypothetical protein GCM10009767_03230 [Kocuria aegyptia]|uniref:Uncharacterized protein n=1 Tax=Kocuria aegyptia TaxID=330943 RepID=A0ABP4W5V2_9MICC
MVPFGRDADQYILVADPDIPAVEPVLPGGGATVPGAGPAGAVGSMGRYGTAS